MAGFLCQLHAIHADHLALDRLDKRLIMADWQYGRMEGRMLTSEHLKEHGFTTLVCPWDGGANKNIECLTGAAAAQNLDGVMLTTWNHLPEMLRYLPVDFSAMWNSVLPEIRKPHFISAALLRRLMPADGIYEECGFKPWEVEDSYTARR